MTRRRNRAAPSPRERPRRDRRAWWAALALAATGALSYANAVSAPPLLDDAATLFENQQIRRLWNPAVLFPDRELPVAGRPIVNLSFALDYAVHGFDPAGYRIVNIAIHVLCALVAFALIRRSIERLAPEGTTGGPAFAFAASLLWAAHPVNSEVIGYITQRTESLMALFYLLTMYASVRALDAPARRWNMMAVVACGLGMACKESMVTAPVMVLLFDRAFVFPAWKEALRARWRLYAGLCATWGVLVMVTWSGPRVHSAGFGTGISVWTYLLNQTVMIVQYLKLAFWPHQLVVHYGFPRPLTLGDVWWQAAVVLSLLSLTIALWIRRPRLGFIFAWFFVTLAPTSSIVPIALEVGAERRMYLPLLALIVLVLIAVYQLAHWLAASREGMSSPDRRRTIGYVALAAVTIALVARTITRNREYQQPLTLATTVLDRWPTGLAHHWVGSELLRADRPAEAVSHLRLAVPDAPRALFTLGVELLREGQHEEAIRQLREFIRREPALLEVPMAHVHAGKALGGLQRWNEAADEARAALQMMPGLADAQALLAEALFKQQMMPEAIDAYRAYLRLEPDELNALGNLGIALAATGRLPEALNVFRRTTVLAPRNGGAWRNLATALLEANRLDEAADAARTAIVSQPDDPVAFDLLAQALARGGQWQDAREALQRGLALDPGNPAMRAHLGRLLAAGPRTGR